MKKYIILIFSLFLFACNSDTLKISLPQKQSNTSVACSLDSFDLADYFNMDYITRFEYEITRYQKLDKENGVSDSIIVFVGSSSIRKWSSLEERFEEIPAINRGFGGSTFPELIYYIDELIFKYNPSVVVVYEGDNDQYFMSPNKIFECACYLEHIIHKKLPNAELIFVSVKPSPARSNKIKSSFYTNKGLKTICEQKNKTYYVDIWSSMLDENSKIKSDIFKKDKLHLNEKGYDIWYNVIFPVVKEKY